MQELNPSKAKTSTNRKKVVIHCICGISKEGTLKQDKKDLAFLKQHLIHLASHDWLEEEWDIRMIGFFTTVITKWMLVRYCDSLYILVLPVGNETGCVLLSNRDALGSSPT
jgi:hypothetical protein